MRNGFSEEYKERKQALDVKKESTHPTMDFKKWEIDQDHLPVPKIQLINDKATALKFMFPKVIRYSVGNTGRQKSQGVLGLLQLPDWC